MFDPEFTQKLERIQAEFSSGLAALGVVQNALDENPDLNAVEALYVVHTFLQGVYDALSCVSSSTSSGDKTG